LKVLRQLLQSLEKSGTSAIGLLRHVKMQKLGYDGLLLTFFGE